MNVSREFRDRWMQIINQEISVMKKLSHILITQVIGSYSVEPITFAILMFPVGHGNLKEFFENMEELQLEFLAGRQNNEYYEARLWLYKWPACLASALAYIHSQGIRHEDIKPSNIIHKGPEIYLTDFSSCSQFNVEGTTSTGSATRTTRLYQAPESFLFDEAGRHGLGSDIFSLGCVFSEMETVLQAEYHIQHRKSHGWRLKDLRLFCFPGSGGDRTQDIHLAYGKAVHWINTWFTISSNESLQFPVVDGPSPFFQRVIRPMLAVERNERPNAASVVQLLLGVFSWRCPCAIVHGTALDAEAGSSGVKKI